MTILKIRIKQLKLLQKDIPEGVLEAVVEDIRTKVEFINHYKVGNTKYRELVGNILVMAKFENYSMQGDLWKPIGGYAVDPCYQNSLKQFYDGVCPEPSKASSAWFMKESAPTLPAGVRRQFLRVDPDKYIKFLKVVLGSIVEHFEKYEGEYKWGSWPIRNSLDQLRKIQNPFNAAYPVVVDVLNHLPFRENEYTNLINKR